jgi:hypothetical protein
MMKHRIAPAVFAAALAASALAIGQTDNTQSASPTIQMVNYTASVEKTIDAKKTKAGDPITLKVVTGAKLNDGTDVIPGSIIEGHIDAITPSENKSDSTMTVTLDKIAVKGGKEVSVRALILAVGTTPSANGSNASSGSSAGPMSQGQQASAPQNTSGLIRIPGLTVASSAHDSNSGTITQEKKNIHLSGSAQVVVTAAVIPEGVILQ